MANKQPWDKPVCLGATKRAAGQARTSIAQTAGQEMALRRRMQSGARWRANSDVSGAHLAVATRATHNHTVRGAIAGRWLTRAGFSTT